MRAYQVALGVAKFDAARRPYRIVGEEEHDPVVYGVLNDAAYRIDQAHGRHVRAMNPTAYTQELGPSPGTSEEGTGLYGPACRTKLKYYLRNARHHGQ